MKTNHDGRLRLAADSVILEVGRVAIDWTSECMLGGPALEAALRMVHQERTRRADRDRVINQLQARRLLSGRAGAGRAQISPT